MQAVQDFLKSITIGEPIKFKGLEIRPIISNNDKSLPYLTLGEAISRGLLIVGEVSEGGSVPNLLVSNVGDIDILILEGEELRGAKQNRIVNTSIIVPAKSEIKVPVSCVEQGRWHYQSRSFSSAENIAFPELRRRAHRSVKSSLRSHGGFESDQGEVWNTIGAKFAVMSMHSESSALGDIVENEDFRVDAELAVDQVKHQPGQIGFLAFINGGFAGGDIFGSSDLCGRQLRKLLRGYYLDAVDETVSFPKIGVEDLLKEIESSTHETFDTIGKGHEGRYESAKVEGAYKVDGENVTHMTVFPK
jgi:hypothetical protein